MSRQMSKFASVPPRAFDHFGHPVIPRFIVVVAAVVVAITFNARRSQCMSPCDACCNVLNLSQRKLYSRSDRVKGVDFHPTEPWLLSGLYNGSVNIYNHETGAIVKTFEVAEVPVRCVKFIARKNWFVAGSDDFQLRVFNYNTHEKVAAFEAHPDYIRCLTVHPTASIVLTGSDDMTIKAWDWEKGWKNIQVSSYITHILFCTEYSSRSTKATPTTS